MVLTEMSLLRIPQVQNANSYRFSPIIKMCLWIKKALTIVPAERFTTTKLLTVVIS